MSKNSALSKNDTLRITTPSNSLITLPKIPERKCCKNSTYQDWANITYKWQFQILFTRTENRITDILETCTKLYSIERLFPF